MNALEWMGKLTPREKCAQLVVPAFRFDDADYDVATEWVKRQGVGGLVVHGGSVFDLPSFVNWAQKVSRVPLLVAADYADGAGTQVAGATRYPPAAAVGSEEFAGSKARQTALEAKALGVRCILGVDPGAFAADAATAVRLGHAALEGASRARVLLALGPLPGSEAGEEELRAGLLAPFAGLAAETDVLQVGPVTLRAFDEHAPVCMSRRVLQGVLRGELKMGGLIAASLPEDAAAEAALNAGADLLLQPKDALAVIDVLEAALAAKRLAESVLDRALRRLLVAKERLGLFAERTTDVANAERVVGCAAHQATARRIAGGPA